MESTETGHTEQPWVELAGLPPGSEITQVVEKFESASNACSSAEVFQTGGPIESGEIENGVNGEAGQRKSGGISKGLEGEEHEEAVKVSQKKVWGRGRGMC